MATATKRPLTDDAHNALIASISPYPNIIGDDLTAALQNIGSRVRKSVYDGYATQRLASVTPTPHSSPVKPCTTPSHNATLFRSANDTLTDIFSSPTRGPMSRIPSPKKRGRAELDDDEVATTAGEDVEMDTAEPDSDDEAVIFVLEPNTGRPVKPLRKPRRAVRSPAAAARAPGAGAPTPIWTPATSALMHVEDPLDWFSVPF